MEAVAQPPFTPVTLGVGEELNADELKALDKAAQLLKDLIEKTPEPK